VTPADVAATRTGADARFVDPVTRQFIMSFHSLVVRTPKGNLLVDACVGNHKERPLLPEWHQQEWPYLERLAAMGLSPADIDYVCCTHLHGDHVGWNTRLQDGQWVPTFPNARYLFAAGELSYWEAYHAVDPGNPYERPWQDSVLPVIAAGQVDRVANDHEILPGICLRHAPGHTPGNVVIEIDDGRRRAIMTGDVMHHPIQIERPHWCSQFDTDPYRAMDTRLGLLERVADTGTTLLGAHFAHPAALNIVRDGDGFFYADA
jgi:glyoxylase-like metal-dependent hydrolase (beta-lactamase superfamily II)